MHRFFRNKGRKEDARTGLTDEQLIHAYVTGNNVDHFGLLFERYTHLVYGLCMKYLKNKPEAEDAVMGIFEKLMSDLKTHQVHDFRNWLYRVAKNHCLMILRKQKTSARAGKEILKERQEEIMEIVHEGHLPEADHEESTLAALYEALGSLKEEQRKCLELMYFDKKSYREITLITGYDLNKVKSHIQNGKRNLKLKMMP